MKTNPFMSMKESSGPRPVNRKWLILASIALMTLSCAGFVNAQGLLYTVTSTGDGGLVGSDNFCDDGTGHCTLRAAIEASNSHPGIDGIDFAIPTSDPGFDPGTGSWTINLTKVLPDISADVGITGPGALLLIVRRNTGGSYRIFKVITAGVVTISGMTISNGDSDGGGGIQKLNTGTLNVTNCALTGNSVFSGNGGGLSTVTGIVNVTNCTLSGNSAAASPSFGGLGGGIFSDFSAISNVTSCTLSENFAKIGGGIFNFAGTVNVTNSTLAGNFASDAAGAIFNDGESAPATLNVTNTTLSSNIASICGGIFTSSDTIVNIKSTISSSNSDSSDIPDVFGSFTSGGFNLIGNVDGSDGFNQPTDQTGTTSAPLDPKLDPNGLQNKSGPTQTIALLFGSPAIDKGTSAGLTGNLTTDQRGAGFLRTFDDPAIANATGGDGTDIGAFEVQTAAPTPSPTPTTLGNISTRLRVETGDNVSIGGFIITGAQPKKVLLRAIGPSLPLAGPLTDPTLELHGGSGALIASNDNWMDAPNKQEIIASTIPPANDLESAILMSLDPGAYTAIVSGVNNTTGIGLVEVYDLDLTVDSTDLPTIDD